MQYSTVFLVARHELEHLGVRESMHSRLEHFFPSVRREARPVRLALQAAPCEAVEELLLGYEEHYTLFPESSQELSHGRRKESYNSDVQRQVGEAL